MHQIDSSTIFNLLSYPDFIPFLREAFSGDSTVPERLHYTFGNGLGDIPSTLLVMPAWQDGSYLGIKLVTLSPYNSDMGIPTLQGAYLLFSAKKGTPLALFDAKAITARRTAAKSAIAASFLARKNSETLLMVGTGTLSTELIQAHCSVLPIRKVLIWEHTKGKGDEVIKRLPEMEQDFEVCNDLSEAVPKADLISVATMSAEPLIKGRWLQPGQHLDMVGAYRTDMREADDEALRRSSLYIDHNDAWGGTGELAIPLEEGVITRDDAKATLFEMCRGEKEGRKNDGDITFFKSTGHALEDLSAALFVYRQLETNPNSGGHPTRSIH